MMKPTYTIAIAAIFMVAAFAGIAMVDDEADAADAGTVTAVSYAGSGITTTNEPVAANATTITINGGETPVAPSAGKALYWTSASGERFYNGEVVAIADIKAEDLVNGVFTLTATVSTATSSYATVVIDGVDYIIPLTAAENASFVKDNDVYVEVKGIVDELTKAGFKLTWSESDPMTAATISNDDEFTLEYSVGKVVWISGITTLRTDNIDDTTEVSIPTAPSIPNRTFLGWALEQDGEVVITYVADIQEYRVAGVEGAATTVDVAESKAGTVTYYAVFESDNITVTLKAEGQADKSALAVYGEKMVEPALPEGFAYWAVMTKEAVLDEEGNVVEPAVYERFDFDNTVITEAITLYAIAEEEVPDESIYATFNIEGTIYGPYKVTDRFSIPQTDREGYNFLGWTVQGGDGTKLTSAQVQNYQYTEDVTFVAVYEVAEPPAPEEPAFYETSTGQIVIVVVIFLILALGYGVYSNAFGLKDKLFGYTIQKKEKKE